MKNHSVTDLWGDFLNQHLEYVEEHLPKHGYFCDNEQDANTCAKLVRKGVKRATSHSLLGLQYREESLPKIGDFFIVTDWDGNASSIIKTVSVQLIPYFNINASFAQLEGEGDKSLTHWKQVHWDYYTRELEPYGRVPRESMIIVCEVFEKLYSR